MAFITIGVILAAVILPALAVTIIICSELRRPNITIHVHDQSDRRSVVTYNAPVSYGPALPPPTSYMPALPAPAPMLRSRTDMLELESGKWYDDTTR